MIILTLANAAFFGFALCWTIDNFIDGRSAKAPMALAAINLAAVFFALI